MLKNIFKSKKTKPMQEIGANISITNNFNGAKIVINNNTFILPQSVADREVERGAEFREFLRACKIAQEEQEQG